TAERDCGMAGDCAATRSGLKCFSIVTQGSRGDGNPGLWVGIPLGFTDRVLTPKGSRPKAQGCEERATLGGNAKELDQPQRGCGIGAKDGREPPQPVPGWGFFPRDYPG